jgi:uncharacterized membrane protein
MNISYRALTFAALTIVMWGLWGFFGKLALDKRMTPIAMFLVETVTSAILAIPVFLMLASRYERTAPMLNVWGVLSGAALAVGLLFYYAALEQAQVSIVVPLTATYPVVAALLGFALLGERPTTTQVAAIVLIVIGVVLLLGAAPNPRSPTQSSSMM